jgi:hypothetical protein
MAATVESEDGVRVQEVGCSTSSTISNEHLMQGNVENKVLEGDSSLSAEKSSISMKARLYIFSVTGHQNIKGQINRLYSFDCTIYLSQFLNLALFFSFKNPYVHLVHFLIMH